MLREGRLPGTEHRQRAGLRAAGICRTVSLALLGGLVLVTPVEGQWVGGWSFRKALVINGGNCGSPPATPCIVASQSDFPVLVSLSSDTDLAARALDSGDDILFTSSDGITQLDHELESFDGLTGALVAWVRLPSLPVGTNTTVYLYYGNGTATSQEDPNGVWDANYRGVWHLVEDPSASQLLDSTSNANHGSPLGGMDAADQVAGQIGGGLDFDAIDDRVDAGSAASLDDLGPLTASAWIWPNDVPGDAPKIVAKYNTAAPDGRWYLEIDDSAPEADALEFMKSHATTDLQVDSVNGVVSYGGWQHVAVTWDGSSSAGNVHIYRDGVEVLYQQTTSGAGAMGSDADMPFIIGGRDIASQLFSGVIDEVRVSSVVRSLGWMQTEYNNATNQGVGPGRFILSLGLEQTTAVELVSFRVVPADSAVILEWETASETRNLGFHLYRSLSVLGPWERITASLIPGLGSSPEGARYAYRDPGLQNGVSYHYLLEDVETTGATKRHGPVSAAPQPGLDDDGGWDDDGDGPASGEAETRLTFGDPEATSVRVEGVGRRGLVVELATGGFYAVPDGADPGSVHLSVPGFDGLPEPGRPSIPSRLAWVPALVGRQVRIASVQARDVVAFDLRPAHATAPALVVADDGTVEAGRRRVKTRRRGGRAVLPERAAALLETAFQGEDKKALLKLSPLRWDPSSGQLLLARRLRVRLVFAGRDKGEVAHQAFRGRRPRPGKPGTEALLAQLVTGAPGLHAVAFESVFPPGGRPVRSSELALTHLGDPVAFRVVPQPSRFGPGSRLLFWSEGPATNPDANEVVFELSRGSGGLVMPSREAAPSGPTVGEILATARFEQNARYQPALVEAPDPWLWDYVISPSHKDFSFDLPGAGGDSSTPGRLTVQLQGVTDFPADPDHHVRLSINGVPLTEVLFEGRAPLTVTAELPASLLVPAGNRLEIHNVGDTEAAYSLVYLDRFAIDYPRALGAPEGAVQGRATLGGAAVVSGLSGGGAPVLLDTTEAVPVWLTGAAAAGAAGDAVAFRVEAGRRYAITDAAAIRPVEVRFPAETTLRDPSTAADWVVIAPRAFAAAAETLERHREGQGLEVQTVFVEEVFDHFGFGETHPEAIRDFLAFAFHHWTRAPRLVLLLGDTTYDPKDFYGTGVRPRIPTATVPTSFLWTASDPLLAAVNGDDALPDLALGRLPAASAEEAQALVDKLIAWETAGFTLDGSAVLVSDNPDSGGDFDADAAEIAATVLADRDPRQIRLSQLGLTEARGAVLEAFDTGASLVSYLGHGAASVWASEGLFGYRDLPALAPQAQQPFVLTFNCLNGYFTMPKMDALAEALLKAEGKGAIAAFSPSSMSVNDAAHVYHRALLTEIVSGRHPRLGDAVLAAQKAYADSGAFPELLGVYHLFGDPGTMIR